MCVIGCALTLTAFLPLLPVNWWWVRIGDYPRVQLLIAYLIAGVFVLLAFKTRLAKVTMGLLALSCAIQTYWIMPYLTVARVEVESARQVDEQSRIRILAANVLQSNEKAQPLLELVSRERPDVLVLCEVNERWVRQLEQLERDFAFHLIKPLDNGYGIALYSNLPVQDAALRHLVKDTIPSIDATVELRTGHPVRLFAVHPNPPRPGEDTTKRDGELVLVGREVKDNPTAIVLGDMNDVGWSRTTNLFQEVSGLLDPRKGRGIYPTFDATSSIWRYPLDYLFHSDDFRLVELRTLPDIGSDHFPLFVELQHAPEAVVAQEAPDLDAGDEEDASKAVEAAKEQARNEKAKGETGTPPDGSSE